jgi:hypothetical protein
VRVLRNDGVVGPIGIGVFIAPSVPYSSADLSCTPKIFFPVRIGKTLNGNLAARGRGTAHRLNRSCGKLCGNRRGGVLDCSESSGLRRGEQPLSRPAR